MLQKIKTALISVSDKENLKNILIKLKKFNIKIISSGGTYKEIKKLGFDCTEISKFTGFKEMLDGRVKTLHPKIHAGILHDRRNVSHLKQMKGKKFPSIDLIVVNFYPFQKIITKTKSDNKIIENIDIGGPTMVRAAAKNFKNVLIITNKKDYRELGYELEKYKGSSSLKFREYMSSKAFGLTAYYDSLIATWFNKKLKINFPERLTIFGRKLEELRYGENPHQKSSIYVSDFHDKSLNIEKLSGKKLSYNNYNDIFSALKILSSLKKNSTVIIKHANPSGISSNKLPLKSFQNARNCDPISAFGGVVACNFRINKQIAKEISMNFVEVICARGFDKLSLSILKKKKNMRIINISNYTKKHFVKHNILDGSIISQDDDKIIYNRKNLRFVTKKKPSKKELNEIEFAFNACKFVKSNAIVISNNNSTIGIGAGQPNRLDSCKIAIQKARKFQKNRIKNCVAASDAFFPFVDGVKELIKAGVKIIVQPGGSIRDDEIIRAANKAKIKMIFTGTRHFNH